ncbi:MAG: hypothetical protein RLZZ04_3170 [Cyanobacteriota bacterium]|jgi:uncharacterized LabA/DUF88 family protein/peptidoglycan hydrolase CwlO-like protein
MTISLNKQNQTSSLVNTRFNSLANSASSFGLATMMIALISLFSGNQFLDKAVTFFLVGSMVQTNVQSKQRHQKVQRDQMILTKQIKALDNAVFNIESEFTANREQITLAQSRLSQIKGKYQLLLEKIESINLQITEIEAPVGDRQLASSLTALRNKVSRLNSQIREAKLLAPDTVKQVEKLTNQIEALDNAVFTLRQEQEKQVENLSLTVLDVQSESAANREQIALEGSRFSQIEGKYQGHLEKIESINLQIIEIKDQYGDLQPTHFPTAENCPVMPPKQPVRPESDRVGIFIDGANVSISAKEIWGYYPDWAKLLVSLRGKSTVYDARYYDALSRNKYELFRAIKQMGYEVISKPLTIHTDGFVKGNLDTELSNDMLVCVNLYDTFVLVSGDGDFLDTVKKLRAVGKRVEVVSFKESTNRDLIRRADCHTNLALLKNQFVITNTFTSLTAESHI